MTKISAKVIKEVKNILPELRDELAAELKRWGNEHKANDEFYSDEHVLTILPHAAYEYIILAWSIDPAQLDKEAVIGALNGKIFKDIRKITAHALRRIVFTAKLKSEK